MLFIMGLERAKIVSFAMETVFVTVIVKIFSKKLHFRYAKYTGDHMYWFGGFEYFIKSEF